MPTAAVIDYGVGNLFSVVRACALAGLDARIVDRPRDVVAAAAVILPGIGAFGDAMHALAQRDLAAPLRAAAAQGTPILGVCLGMQLLMDESHEFGSHKGLGLVSGSTERLTVGDGVKIPHVAWNQLWPSAASPAWDHTMLRGLPHGSAMYFVHSYAVQPVDRAVIVAETSYGGARFPAAIQAGNIYGFQCHPERSGPTGLTVYRNFAELIDRERTTEA
jgi:glutamine amidotransferase